MALWLGDLYNLGVLPFHLNTEERMMSEKTPGLDREKLRAELMEEFEQVFQKVVDAVDDAEAGHIIRQSEEPVRDAMDAFRKKVFESALQAKVDAAEASFPPAQEPYDGQAKKE
jgi:hypothetical protein